MVKKVVGKKVMGCTLTHLGILTSCNTILAELATPTFVCMAQCPLSCPQVILHESHSSSLISQQYLMTTVLVATNSNKGSKDETQHTYYPAQSHATLPASDGPKSGQKEHPVHPIRRVCTGLPSTRPPSKMH